MQNERPLNPTRSSFLAIVEFLTYPFRAAKTSASSDELEEVKKETSPVEALPESFQDNDLQGSNENGRVEAHEIVSSQESILFLDKITEVFCLPESEIMTLIAVSIDTPEASLASAPKLAYQGILSKDALSFVGKRIYENQNAIHTYEGVFSVKIIPKGGMTIGVVNKEAAAKFTIQYTAGPNDGDFEEYLGNFRHLRPYGKGQVTYLRKNASLKIIRTGNFDGFSIQGPCEMEVVSHTALKKIAKGTFENDPGYKLSLIKGEWASEELIGEQWHRKVIQSGLFRCDLLSSIPGFIGLQQGDCRVIYPNGSHVYYRGKFTNLETQDKAYCLSNSDAPQEACERKTVLRESLSEVHESGVFHLGVLREGVLYTNQNGKIITCYEGKFAALGFPQDENGLMCQYSSETKTLSAVCHLGCGNAQNRCWYLIEVQEGVVLSITGVIAKSQYHVQVDAHLESAETNVSFYRLNFPETITQILWRLELSPKGHLKCTKPDARRVIDVDADKISLWDKVKKLVEIMQVLQAEILHEIKSKFIQEKNEPKLSKMEQDRLIEELLVSESQKKQRNQNQKPKPSSQAAPKNNKGAPEKARTIQAKISQPQAVASMKPFESTPLLAQSSELHVVEDVLQASELALCRQSSAKNVVKDEVVSEVCMLANASSNILDKEKSSNTDERRFSPPAPASKRGGFHSIFPPPLQEDDFPLQPGEIRIPSRTPPSPVLDWAVTSATSPRASF